MITALFQSIAQNMESEFYVTLPKYSSMQYFPDNKNFSNFLTKLPRTLQLDGEWEVGLAEIDYPHTWYNIREGKNSVEIYVPDKWYQDISNQPGYYQKVQDVIDALLKAGLANVTDVVVSYDDTSKRVTVRCAKGTALELRGDIARMFGYLVLPKTENQYFYVYTDIIKSQYYGDVVVPVLRTVTVKGEHGSYVSKNFERPHYVPLNKKIFGTISINIRDEARDLVAFEHGKVIITLHFRRSKTQHFI